MRVGQSRWNGKGLEWNEVERLRDRYGKAHATLRSLEEIRFGGCRNAVTKFRDFWSSLPQLAEISQLTEVCDRVLVAVRWAPLFPGCWHDR